MVTPAAKANFKKGQERLFETWEGFAIAYPYDGVRKGIFFSKAAIGKIHLRLN